MNTLLIKKLPLLTSPDAPIVGALVCPSLMGQTKRLGAAGLAINNKDQAICF
jgi:hypothetical protein